MTWNAGNTGLKRIAAYVGVACLCVILTWVAVKRFTSSVREPGYPIARQIRYSFTLQNTTNQLLKEAEFWTYAPVKQTATQRCVKLDSSHPYELISDDLGNQVLHFKFDHLPPYASKIITINAELELSETPNRISDQDLQRFLGAEKYVESEAPEVSGLAQKLRGPKPLKTAENIFRWVAEHVTYTGYSGSDRGALYALKHEKGDCTEFMYLFAALCRANDIPSQCVGGYICRENTVLRPGGYHNWAEIYEDGVWMNVDPQNKVFMQNPSHYVAMRMIGDAGGNSMGGYHRFRFKGDGLKVRMNG